MANTRRVLLLGKTGSGKSSLAKTIFNDVFSVNHSPNSETNACYSVTRTVYGRTLTLIDTPGLSDTDPNSSLFRSELKRCLEECAPGPLTFLLVLKVKRYTPQEQAVVDLIVQYFSPEALKYTTVLFTHGDNLPPGMRITEWAQENPALRSLLQKCGNRCHVVDNRRWRNQGDMYRNNQKQVQELLNTIDRPVAENGTRRVVLLGKTGSGKSSLANTIFGSNSVFRVNHSPNSETSGCCSDTRTIYGRTLTLIDTPGLFDTDPNSSAFTSEIMRCLEKCAPGPHAFLLVLKVEKYTPLEQAVVDLILQYFSPEALRYTTVVFTHGDDLPPGMRITEWAQQNPALRVLLQKCRNRCHVVDNRRWRNQGDIYRNNQNQVQELLNTIDRAVAANGGSYYTNDLLQNPSLWGRFRDAPTGVQIALILGVAAAGYLLYTYVPWSQVMEWVIQGARYGEAWIRANVKIKDIIPMIVYLSGLYNSYQALQTKQKSASQSSGSICTVH